MEVERNLDEEERRCTAVIVSPFWRGGELNRSCRRLWMKVNPHSWSATQRARTHRLKGDPVHPLILSFFWCLNATGSPFTRPDFVAWMREDLSLSLFLLLGLFFDQQLKNKKKKRVYIYIREENLDLDTWLNHGAGARLGQSSQVERER